MKRTALSVVALAVLPGCFTIPMSPDEYRAAIRNHNAANVETFEVKRPVAEVARSFRRKAAECLSYELTSTKTPTIGFGSSTRVYAIAKPTAKAVGKDRTRIEIYRSGAKLIAGAVRGWAGGGRVLQPVPLKACKRS